MLADSTVDVEAAESFAYNELAEPAALVVLVEKVAVGKPALALWSVVDGHFAVESVLKIGEVGADSLSPV